MCIIKLTQHLLHLLSSWKIIISKSWHKLLGVLTVKKSVLGVQMTRWTHRRLCPCPPHAFFWKTFKGQMHHHDDLGSKCAYTCHLSNKTTRKSVLLSTPQIWLMKVSKKLAWVWVWRLTLSEVVLMKWLAALLLIGWEISVASKTNAFLFI